MIMKNVLRVGQFWIVFLGIMVVLAFGLTKTVEASCDNPYQCGVGGCWACEPSGWQFCSWIPLCEASGPSAGAVCGFTSGSVPCDPGGGGGGKG